MSTSRHASTPTSPPPAISLWALVLTLTSCAPTGEALDAAAESAAASVAMDSVYAIFADGYARLDPAAVADLYTEDALYLPPGGEVRHGRDTIAATFARFFGRVREAGESLTIRFTSDDRGAEGNLAYDIGYYDLSRFLGDSLVGRGRGKFVTVWRRGDDGRWRIHSDGYNDAP